MSDSEDIEVESVNDVFSDLVTLGESSDFEPVRWLFPNTTKCPMKQCGLNYSNRNVALAHFELYHARTAMTCTVCNHLFSVENPLNLFIHYKKKHPREKPPTLKQTNSNSTNNDSDELEEDDFIITLKGSGKSKRWRFPQQTHCPFQTCDASFSTRIAALVHFRSEHANGSTFCDLCGTPILARHPDDLKRHNRQNHPQIEQPNNAEIQPRLVQKKETKNEQENIWISLERTSKLVCWEFPNTNRCPVKNCCIVLKDRLAAISHYKGRHLPNSTFCSLCEKPIYGRRPSDVDYHYRQVHPKKLKSHRSKEKTGSPKRDALQENVSDDREDDLVILSGGGHITQWNFPDTTLCPVMNCRLRFQNRSQAIEHYREKHAKFAILCSICGKPIRVDTNKNGFIYHYRATHPNHPLPFDFESTLNTTNIKTAPKRTVLSTSTVQNDNVENNENDLITLRGLKYITQWTFPERTTRCPFQNCRKEFGTRSNAITHYKNQHAAPAILCTICNKPICVRSAQEFKTHYHRIHPNVPLPFPFQQQTVDTSDDDMITLTGLHPTCYWRFPQTKRCPVHKCNMTFDSRSATIVHYKTKHSMNFTLCSVCKKPVSANSYNLKMHYSVKHPNAEPQVNSIDLRENTKSIDDSSEKIRHSIQRNVKKIHTSDNIICPLKDCRFEAKQMHELRQHWDKEHGELRFPEIRPGPFATNSTRAEDDNHQSNKNFPQAVEKCSNGSVSQSPHSAITSSKKQSSNDNASDFQNALENSSCSSFDENESPDSDINEVEKEKRRKRVREMRKLNFRSRGNKRSRNKTNSSSSDTSADTNSSDDQSSETGILSRHRTHNRSGTNEITAEMLPQCFVMLERSNYQGLTLNIPVVNTGNRPAECETVYVPDSDEENLMDQGYDLDSNSDSSHIPTMGVLMMAKKPYPETIDMEN